MPAITVEDIGYVRFGAPELELARQFLLDFGFQDADRTQDSLAMSGSGGRPCMYLVEKGPPGFRGIGLRTSSSDDVERLAMQENVPVEELELPGGGVRARLIDPNGVVVDVMRPLEKLGSRSTPRAQTWNTSESHDRGNALKRLQPGPSTIVRLGHVVFFVNDLRQTWTWWNTRFRLLVSDGVRGPDGELTAVFVRFDRGTALTDHHCLNFATAAGTPAHFHHAAFEVLDFDDMMTGHEHLNTCGYSHLWGVGRHVLGSQVFDYWFDPWGNRIEHYTDGDLLRASDPERTADLETMLGSQWGPPVPPGFV